MADSATVWTVAWQAPLPMEFLGKNIGVGCHALLQGIFPAQGLNPFVVCLLHWQVGSLTTNAIWEAHIKKYTCLKYTIQLLWYIQSYPTTLLPNARTLSSWKETLYPVVITTYPHPNHYYVDLPTVDISYKWNHTKSGLYMSDFYCLA